MFLAKIKPTVLTLLMTVCLSAGAVTLTYGAGEPGTKAAPPSASARADKYDLESLRLELAALRASLEATRERVKSLEADVEAQKSLEKSRATLRANVTGGLGDSRGGLGVTSDSASSIRQAINLGELAYKLKASLKPSVVATNAEADLRAAAAKVLLDPTDAKARQALMKAVEEMNRQAKPKPADGGKP